MIFTSDRGLAGAFNSQVLREAEELAELLRSQGKDVVYFLVGRKAVGYFPFRTPRVRAAAGSAAPTTPSSRRPRRSATRSLEAFLRDAADGGVDEIHIVYNRFVSMLTQAPEVVRLLPLEVVEGVEEPAMHDGARRSTSSSPTSRPCSTRCCRSTSRAASSTRMLQSAAAKHAATQKAMKSASDNADKLITRLHPPGEQRAPGRDHAADFRDRGRRRRASSAKK